MYEYSGIHTNITAVRYGPSQLHGPGHILASLDNTLAHINKHIITCSLLMNKICSWKLHSFDSFLWRYKGSAPKGCHRKVNSAITRTTWGDRATARIFQRHIALEYSSESTQKLYRCPFPGAYCKNSSDRVKGILICTVLLHAADFMSNTRQNKHTCKSIKQQKM